jgi:hypothetical protein
MIKIDWGKVIFAFGYFVCGACFAAIVFLSQFRRFEKWAAARLERLLSARPVVPQKPQKTVTGATRRERSKKRIALLIDEQIEKAADDDFQ